jgi:hypothetical protein
MASKKGPSTTAKPTDGQRAKERTSVRARRAPAAPAAATPGKRAAPTRRAATLAATETHLREGSKSARVLDLLKRPNGASTDELLEVTGWQKHSLRGFLSGIVRKRMGLTVSSIKEEAGGRRYALKA